jgi:hypothetical protein
LQGPGLFIYHAAQPRADDLAMLEQQGEHVSCRQANVRFLPRHGKKGSCAAGHGCVRLLDPFDLHRLTLGEVGLVQQISVHVPARGSRCDRSQQSKYAEAVWHQWVRGQFDQERDRIGRRLLDSALVPDVTKQVP